MNYLNKLKKAFPQNQDELLGGWYKGAEDGSGLNAIWGYGLEFKHNGEGIYHSWGTEEEIERTQAFEWGRINENTIQIKFKTGSDWEEIGYEISDFMGAYNAKYKKLVKSGTEGFWCSPEPLYQKL